MPPCFTIEMTHPGPIFGVDEAGRGPLAGPVVAAAVILDRDCVPDGVNDSKKLDGARRARLAAEIRSCAYVGVGIATVEEIDSLNILWATMLAMERAVEEVIAVSGLRPGQVLVDGNRLPRWSHPSTAVIKGDALCLSIAAASIIAKHARDTMMEDYDRDHPGYGWAANKGYGTSDHCEALARLGPTPLHRRSFAPVAQAVLRFA